jgi:hypothetical protein
MKAVGIPQSSMHEGCKYKCAVRPFIADACIHYTFWFVKQASFIFPSSVAIESQQ